MLMKVTMRHFIFRLLNRFITPAVVGLVMVSSSQAQTSCPELDVRCEVSRDFGFNEIYFPAFDGSSCSIISLSEINAFAPFPPEILLVGDNNSAGVQIYAYLGVSPNLWQVTGIVDETLLSITRPFALGPVERFFSITHSSTGETFDACYTVSRVILGSSAPDSIVTSTLIVGQQRLEQQLGPESIPSLHFWAYGVLVLLLVGLVVRFGGVRRGAV